MEIGIIIFIFLIFLLFPTLTIFSLIVSFFAIKTYFIIIPGVILFFIIDLLYIGFIANKINGKSSNKYDEEFIKKVAVLTSIKNNK